MMRQRLSCIFALGFLLILPFVIYSEQSSEEVSDQRALINQLWYELEHGSDIQRIGAVQHLSMLRSRRSVEPLMRAARHDQHPLVRQHACEALGKLNSYRPTRTLLEIAEEDDNVFVQQAAIKAIGEIGNRNAVEPLKRLLKKRIFFLIPALEEALTRLGVTRSEIDRLEGFDPPGSDR